MKPSGIGGQAVIEGVMMKNGDKYAVAVRKPNNEICVEVKEKTGAAKKNPLLGLPILRGVAAFVESLSLGMSCLTFSASFYEDEEEESGFEKKLNEITKGHADSILNAVTIVFAVALALGIFVALPMLLANFLSDKVESQMLLALMEGVLRVVIFIGYVLLISGLKDIQRLFMYHGAEHKSINCIENGLPLTVENVRKQSREHKRCGTSFMLTVMIISIIFFMFIRVENPALRLVVRLLLIPVIAGVSYEFIKLAGRSNSKLVDILSRPGMWLQALTTREPEDDMIEVAIQSVEAVFDWKAFVEPEKKEKGKKKPGRKKKTPAKAEAPAATTEEVVINVMDHIAAAELAEEKLTVAAVAEAEVAEAAVEIAVTEEKTAKPEPVAEAVTKAPVQEVLPEEKPEESKETAQEMLEVDIASLFDIKLTDVTPKKKPGRKPSKKTPKKDPMPEATRTVSTSKEVEDDDVLKALDMYFEFSGPKSVMEISDEVAEDEKK